MKQLGTSWCGFDWLWFLAWGLASSLWCLTASGQLGATFDEPGDLARGLEWWRTGSHRALLKVGAMPLPMDLDTLPLYLWERWHGKTFDLVNGDLDGPLPWARAGTLVFWWLLLAYGRLAGRHIAGPWGGRLAVALLACEPCLLAHATLATKDIAVSACLLALVYHFTLGREAGWAKRVALPAAWYGAAVLAKASGLVFGPLCLLVVEGDRLARAFGASRAMPSVEPSRLRRLWRAFAPFRKDLTWIMAGGLALCFLYCGCDWAAEPSFVAWARQLPDGPAARCLVWVAEHLTIFTSAGDGLVRQISHNMRGHDGVYLLGHIDRRAIWYYFPLALTMKLSVPLLVLPLVVAVCRPRALANWACLAAAGLLVYSLNCRVQIGIRLVLPLVVLGIVGLAGALVRAGQAAPNWRRGLMTATACAAMVWTAWGALAVWPYGLCYTNEFWGGTANGYLCLSDSNYDWGQGLKELAAWQRQRHVDRLDVWYFGTDPGLKAPGFHNLPLHALPTRGPADVLDRVRGRYLAVSTTLLHGVYGMFGDVETDTKRAVTFLHTCRPVDRTSTFFIFDFTGQTSLPAGTERVDLGSPIATPFTK
jgi:hypothetical protein